MKYILCTTVPAIKTAVLSVIFFTVCVHILQALWITRNKFSMAPRKYSDLGNHKERTQSHAFTEIPNTTAVSTATSSIERVKYYRWNSGSLQCSYKAGVDFKNSTNTTLPAKYLDVMWPPNSCELCGEGGLLNPWSLNKVKKAWMIFVVKSAPHHYAFRNTVRTTWGSVSKFYDKKMYIVFLLGLPVAGNRTESWQKALEWENAAYGDILQCPIDDTYKNLPRKVIRSFYWILQRNITGAFYTFTDNDCLMKITNIYAFFHHLKPIESKNNIYCGFCYNPKGKPVRNPKNKWFISKQQYSEDKYPTFCHGGMYTMKKQMIKSMLCISEITNTSGFPLEDVMITGILREKLEGSNRNVKPITTATGKKYDVMYYPWDGTQPHVLWKLRHKWEVWNRTLLQYRQRKLLETKPLPDTINFSLVSQLFSFWGNNGNS